MRYSNVVDAGEPPVIALLKGSLLGIHQGRVSHQQLGFYLDEFTFRVNRRRSQHRGMLFYRLAQQAVAVAPAPPTTASWRPVKAMSPAPIGEVEPSGYGSPRNYSTSPARFLHRSSLVLPRGDGEAGSGPGQG